MGGLAPGFFLFSQAFQLLLAFLLRPPLLFPAAFFLPALQFPAEFFVLPPFFLCTAFPFQAAGFLLRVGGRSFLGLVLLRLRLLPAALLALLLFAPLLGQFPLPGFLQLFGFLPLAGGFLLPLPGFLGQPRPFLGLFSGRFLRCLALAL